MNEEYPLGDWVTLTCNANWVAYGGAWMVDSWHDVAWLIRFDNLADWGDDGLSCEIHLVNLESEAIPDALEYCGVDTNDDGHILIHGSWHPLHGDERSTLVKACVADCLLSYGATAQMWSKCVPCGEDEEDEIAEKMLVEAHNEILRLQTNPGDREAVLDSTCNKIGATWRDNMGGDLIAPLRRKAVDVISGKNPDVTQAEKLLFKMYAASNGKTLGGGYEPDLAVAGRLLELGELKEEQ